MPFVSSSIYHKARRLSLQEGLAPELLHHHAGRKEITDGSRYLPMELLLDVYELADHHLEAGFGVRQGRQLNPDDYGTVGLSWKTCWRAREVLDRIERYIILVTDEGSVRIEEFNGVTRFFLIRKALRKGMEIANEASFVMITGVIQEVTGKPVFPVEVSFEHTPRTSPQYASFFRCPVRFGQADNAIFFRAADIDIPTIKADASIHRFLVERMNEEKEGIHANADTLLSEIHKLVEEALPSGIPSVIQVAEYLGMSARTLKRRLADKHLTFRDLVQNIQQSVATDLLKKSSRSVAEIAFQTGFSEQSAFNRAFKRWTGLAPADYRKTA